jgi:transcriptional regulator with XRE-family HTH domain
MTDKTHHPREILEPLGARIRHLRTKQGLSLDALAAMAELKENDLGDLERGELDPSVKTLLRIAQALKMDVATLCEGV